MGWVPARIAARIEYMQRAYDASGRPPGRVLFRNGAGWWVRTARGKYEKLGRQWKEVEVMLRMGR